MKEINVKIRGGLGNQLFQYAYAKKIQKELKEAKIILDISYFNKKHIRNININEYILNNNVSFEKKADFLYSFMYYIYRIKNRIYKKFGKIYESVKYIFGKKIYIFCNKSLEEELDLRNKNKIFLAGYFQQERDIAKVIEDIRKDVTLINPLSKNASRLLTKLETFNSSIAISIRIGEDYKKYGWPICKKEYYIAGLNYLINRVDSPIIFIFSDNIELVKNENWFERFENVVYVENCKAVEGLEIMRKCQNFVIANSTYSWWGAYLSEYVDKKIVAPKYFYNNVLMKESAINIPNAVYLDNETGEKI